MKGVPKRQSNTIAIQPCARRPELPRMSQQATQPLLDFWLLAAEVSCGNRVSVNTRTEALEKLNYVSRTRFSQVRVAMDAYSLNSEFRAKARRAKTY
jgi:hypothetical protein